MTPTDINQAIARKLSVLKFFPAEAAGGVKVLRAIGGPYVGIRFIPTGGINRDNLADYLSLPMVHACGGSFMVKRQLITAGEFEAITQLAWEAVNIVAEVRNRGDSQ